LLRVATLAFMQLELLSMKAQERGYTTGVASRV